MKSQSIITVSSVQDASTFYCGLLGAQPGHGGDEYEQILSNGDLILQLHAFGADDNHASLGGTNASLGNGVVIWFETDDFEGLLARVEKHDITLDRAPAENPAAKQMEAWFHDPDGYQIVIAGPSAYPRQPIEN